MVLKQKQEKERLQSLPYIERSRMVEAQKWLSSDLIKVILGPRRAGKSVFSLMLLHDTPFAYFNFDDETITKKKFHYDELLQELHAVYGGAKCLFLDEIQNLPRWELWVNRLQREGYNLVLTGSNANLLSQELATALTGRHIPISIFPFSFQEFLLAKQVQVSSDNLLLPEEKGRFLHLAESYLHTGGYPEIVMKDLDHHEYLKVLFDSLLFKDVVKRHRVRFSEQIDQLASYLINNVAHLYSLRKLTTILGFKSDVTLEKYLRYLQEAYILFSLSCYSYKAAERLKSPRKIYVIDNGFIDAKAVQLSPELGPLLENLVFMELIHQGFEPHRHLFYYKTRNDREIDFVLKRGTDVEALIQVAYAFDHPDVEQREIKALVEAAQELKVSKLTILTWNQEKIIHQGGYSIEVLPFWKKFLRLS
jgi:hypothetical protein